MESNETRLYAIEKELLELAKQSAESKRRLDENDKWRSSHELEHLTRHNEIMTNITAIAVDVGIIKTDRIKEETVADIKSKNRKDLFDRLIRVALAIVVLAGAVGAFIDLIRG